ncbi:hypothetical protein ACP70R_024697 [Stipagrostis hirtigluma subsp. patula]
MASPATTRQGIDSPCNLRPPAGYITVCCVPHFQGFMARYSIPMLLLGLLAGAAALAGAVPTAGGSEVSISALAAEVAASCAAGEATTPCCGAVLASVELAGGGSASLRRVASEAHALRAGLDAASLLALFANCRGLPRPAASDVPALRSSTTVVPSSTSAAGAPARRPVLAAEMKDAAAQPSSAPNRGAGALPSEPHTLHLSGDDRKALLVMVVAQVLGLAMTLLLVIHEVFRCFHPKK